MKQEEGVALHEETLTNSQEGCTCIYSLLDYLFVSPEDQDLGGLEGNKPMMT